MTAASTVASIVALPLLLLVYASSFSKAELTIPYGSIVQTLAVVLLPVAIGMALRAKSLRGARILGENREYRGRCYLSRSHCS